MRSLEGTITSVAAAYMRIAGLAAAIPVRIPAACEPNLGPCWHMSPHATEAAAV
jgi:hypothetical protein